MRTPVGILNTAGEIRRTEGCAHGKHDDLQDRDEKKGHLPISESEEPRWKGEERTVKGHADNYAGRDPGREGQLAQNASSRRSRQRETDKAARQNVRDY